MVRVKLLVSSNFSYYPPILLYLGDYRNYFIKEIKNKFL
nr:MAG TPA: hypothetical protein [Caudoviricetes sp.]